MTTIRDSTSKLAELCRAVGIAPGATGSELAARLGYAETQLGPLLHHLVEKGVLIIRHEDNPRLALYRCRDGELLALPDDRRYYPARYARWI